jgi:hypothetical protein
MQNDAKNSLDSTANNYPQVQPGSEKGAGVNRMMLKSRAGWTA